MTDHKQPARPATVSLIAAMSENRVIGRAGGLPWKMPADMRYFMQTTKGHTVIMGRKTWETMKGALKERRNIVVTRDAGYKAAGAEVAANIETALAMSAGDGEVFVIGGQQIYEAALGLADRIYLTVIHTEVTGDAYFPELKAARWTLRESRRHEADEKNEFSCTFNIYELTR